MENKTKTLPVALDSYGHSLIEVATKLIASEFGGERQQLGQFLKEKAEYAERFYDEEGHSISLRRWRIFACDVSHSDDLARMLSAYANK